MGAVNIQGNIGTTYSPGTILKTYLSPTPINYASTEYGVLLEDVNAAAVGSSTGARNTFKNLQNGVRMVRSNAHVIRNDFLNLNTGYNNKAIWAVGDYVTSPSSTPPYSGFGTKHRFLVGIGTSNNCTFKNLKYGIYSDSCMTNKIQNNDFKDVNGIGVAVYRSSFYRGSLFGPDNMNFLDRDTSYITNNVFSPIVASANVMQNGVGMFDNAYIYAYTVANTMTLNPLSNVWSEGISVYHATSNKFSSYITAGNLITGNGNYGIHEYNNADIVGPTIGTRGIISNTITVGTGYCAGFFDTPNVGVYSVNSPYAVISENIIDETSLGSAPACMIGVYVSNGQADNIGCNLMKNTDISCAVDLNNVGSTYKGNVMNTALIGLYNVNGTLGTIGSSGNGAQNEWISNTWSTYVANYGGAASNVYYDNSISDRIPSTNGASAAFPYVPQLTTAGSLGCTMHHKGGNNNQIQPSNNNDNLVTDIINGNVQFPQYNEGLLWEHRNGILNLLKDSLLDNENPVFSQFRANEATTNLGKINSLMRSIGNYGDVIQNKNNYVQELSSVSTSTNVVEQNYQLFLNEYINNISGTANISEDTKSNIKQLAQKCPYSDGAVVYNARALMKIWGNDEMFHNACEVMTMSNGQSERKSNTSTIQNTENVLVYPNPNNGSFSIAYTFEQSGQEFILYDLMGKEVIHAVLENNEGTKQLSNRNLNSGIYFYKILNGNKTLFSGKLVINK